LLFFSSNFCSIACKVFSKYIFVFVSKGVVESCKFKVTLEYTEVNNIILEKNFDGSIKMIPYSD